MRPKSMTLMAIFLLLLTLPLLAWAQPSSPEADALLGKEILKPANTSSPRGTLRTFLDNANKGYEFFRSGTPWETIMATMAKAGSHTLQALDFSQVENGDRLSTQFKYAILLKEVLDRIPLPPDAQIPGDREVAEQGVVKWTIPGTSIVITQVKEGPRKGEFLFAAETVKQLERLYFRAKKLPYQPGATEGFYEMYLEKEGLSEEAIREVRKRLKPLDTASPRLTFKGFIDSLDRAYALIMEANAGLRAEPPILSREEAAQAKKVANLLLRPALLSLDLSEVPIGIRDDVGIEVALQLKEVIDRVPRPFLEEIPDAEAVRAQKRADKEMLGTPLPFSWQLPNTEIRIVQVQEGPRAGEFLFSADTVRRAEDFYEAARDLPYRPGATEGFYNHFISTPGHLIPAASSWWIRWVLNLPAEYMTVYYEQTLWQWIGLGLVMLAALLVVLLAWWLLRALAWRLREPYEAWIKLLPPLFTAWLALRIHDFINHDLNITGGVLSITTQTLSIVFYLALVWVVFNFFQALAETIIASPKILHQSIDASLLRLVGKIVGFFAAGWVFIAGAQELGFRIVPLLAGLGVGGLAVALAAQRTFANVIGGVVLFVTRPVRVGDFCRYGDQVGTVEDIGLISTQIRSLERTIVTVPNAAFSEMQLDNFAVRDMRLLKTVLQLRYETTADQLRFVLAKLRELLLGHPMVTPDPARARFLGYGPYSKDIEVFAYLRCQDQNTFLAIQEDIMLRIEDIVGEAGAGFAFPSQTAYLARDTGLDSEQAQQATGQVVHWRGRGKLPFPEFDEEERERLEDILDYPPKGSPDFMPRNRAPDTPAQSEPQR